MAQGSEKSLQTRNSDAGSQRLVPEEDLKKEREKWMQMSMRQVWNLENAASERINSQIEEAVRQMQQDAKTHVIPQVEAERAERISAVAELRTEVQAQRASIEAELASLHTNLASALQAMRAATPVEAASDSPNAEAVELAQSRLRRELEAFSAEHRAELHGVRAQAEQGRLQTLAVESAVRDLRNDLSLRADQQEAAHSQLRQDLRRELEHIRGEFDVDRRHAEEQASHINRTQTSVSELRSIMEETTRRLGELKQDQLSQTTVLQSRVEAAVGDREEHQSHIDSMRLLFKEEQGRHNAESAALRKVEAAIADLRGRVDDAVVLPTRVEALEGAFKDTIAAVTRQLDGPHADSVALASRVAALEQGRGVKVEQSGHVEELFASTLADLRKRLESIEAVRGDVDGTPPGATASLKEEFVALRSDVQRLAQDLADERRDRCRAVTDVNRLTEDVAKAAAATIEKAERKLLDEWGDRSNPGSSQGWSPGIVRTPNDIMSPPVVDVVHERASPSSNTARATLSSGFARLVGEMDAELRVELNSRIKLLATELRSEILSETSAKVAGLESRTSALEANVLSKMQRLADDLSLCFGREDGTQLAQKVGTLEGDMKRTSIMLSAFLEEQKKKATTTALDALEAETRRGKSSVSVEAAFPEIKTDTTQPSSLNSSMKFQGGAEPWGGEANRCDYPAKDRLLGLISAIDRERSIDHSLDRLRESLQGDVRASPENAYWQEESRQLPPSEHQASPPGALQTSPRSPSQNKRSVPSMLTPESTGAGSSAAPVVRPREGRRSGGVLPRPGASASPARHSEAAPRQVPTTTREHYGRGDSPVRRDAEVAQRAAKVADGTDEATQSWPGAHARYHQGASPGGGGSGPGSGMAQQASGGQGPSWHGGVQWPTRGNTLAAPPAQAQPNIAPPSQTSRGHPGGQQTAAQPGMQPGAHAARGVPMAQPPTGYGQYPGIQHPNMMPPRHGGAYHSAAGYAPQYPGGLSIRRG